jgi:DNA-binding MarR family transcriptional regulator
LTSGMNEIALGVKRTFHGFLRITRQRFASVGLTAARFDMLYAVRKHGLAFRREDPVTINQSDLRRVLGVTATVVSRMVRALETLGLVERHRHGYGDRRQIRVTLTKRGLQTVNRACRLLLRRVQRSVYKAICYGHHRDSWKRLFAMDTLESYLRVLRKRFRDTATLYYPWGHPDD